MASCAADKPVNMTVKVEPLPDSAEEDDVSCTVKNVFDPKAELDTSADSVMQEPCIRIDAGGQWNIHTSDVNASSTFRKERQETPNFNSDIQAMAYSSGKDSPNLLNPLVHAVASIGDITGDHMHKGVHDSSTKEGNKRKGSTEEKSHVCTYCAATFHYKADLSRHFRTHTGEKPYACEHCPAVFIQMSHLKYHVNTHMGHTPFECSVCHASFSRSETLRQHSWTHTKERPYLCRQCSRTYTHGADLRRHLKIHGAGRLYSCTRCTASFNDLLSLTRHIQNHPGDNTGDMYSEVNFTVENNGGSHTSHGLDANLSSASETSRDMNIGQGAFVSACLSIQSKSSFEDEQSDSDTSITPDVSMGVNLKEETEMVDHGGNVMKDNANVNIKQEPESESESNTSRRPENESSNLETLVSVDDLVVSNSFCRDDSVGIIVTKPVTDCRRVKSIDGLNDSDLPVSRAKEGGKRNVGEKKHVCGHCMATFRYRADLSRHVRTHTGEKPYSCDHCPAAFKQISHLNDHRKCHTGDRPFVCDVCGADFSRSETLKQHSWIHSGKRPFPCHQCSRSFTRGGDLRRHLKIHNAGRLYPCTRCTASFNDLASLTKHMHDHAGEETFVHLHNGSLIDYLEHTTTSTIDMPKVSHTVENSDSSRIAHILDTNLSSASDTSRDANTEQGASIRTHSSVQSNRVLNNDGSDLETSMDADIKPDISMGVDTRPDISMGVDMGDCTPMKTNDSDGIHFTKVKKRKKSHVCGHCMATFCSGADLSRHFRIHTGEKPYSCEYCHAAYKQIGHLKDHMKSHTGYKPFVCTVCNAAFTRSGTLRQHVRKHTGERPYSCHQCSSTFTRSSDLRRHLKIHNADRPHPCMLCSASFNDYMGLNKHMRIHAGQETFVHCMEQGIAISTDSTVKSNSTVKNDLPDCETSMGDDISPDFSMDVKESGVVDPGGNVKTDFTHVYIKQEPASELESNTHTRTSSMSQKESNHSEYFKSDANTSLQTKTSEKNRENDKKSKLEPSLLQEDLCTESHPSVGFSVNPLVHAGAGTGACMRKRVKTELFTDDSGIQKTSTSHNSCDDETNTTSKRTSPSPFNRLGMHPPLLSTMPVAACTRGFSPVCNDDCELPVRFETSSDPGMSEDSPDGKNYKCSECSMSFRLPWHLKDHARTHSGEKPFECPQCHAAFSRSSALKRHMYTHTSEKPFACTQCDSAFKQKCYLKQHMKIHDEERLECEQCDATFTRLSELKQHMRIHTGDQPYVCNVCDASFFRRGSWNAHMKIHSGDRPFKCPQCDATFVWSNSLKHHMKIHSGDRPFACDQCTASFHKHSELKKHLKIHKVTATPK